MKKLRCKKAVIISSIAASFLLGIVFSEPIKDLRKNFYHEPAKGFYEKPYNLEIRYKKNIEGKIETYLYDEETKQYQKIGPKMYVGDYRHRIKSATDIPKEIVKDKGLDFLDEVYEFFFSD